MQVLGGESSLEGGIPLTCVPSTAFKADLDAMKVSKASFHGLPVKLTWANNLEVDLCDTGDPIDGYVEDLMQDAYYGYLLTVRVVNYTNKDGVRKQVTAVVTRSYDGSVALRDKVVAHCESYVGGTVKTDNTYGDGAIISINTSTKKCDILF